MKTHLLPAIKITLITMVLFGVVYPFVINGIAIVVAPNGGNGEEVIVDGRVVGFELIGQKFDQDRYFNGRPSAVDYNAASTGGSNKGPSNPEYLETVKARIDTFLLHNPTTAKREIPVDLVTASGGGLDPHISPQAALIQVERIAKVRHMDKDLVSKLVAEHIEQPILGLGTARVHVLRLNIALDQLQSSK
ncbi:K(+)-transporting ATPase subunit C [Chryseolinea sp. T2]|uniref:K(+)-transporting ATPase subunit C n=1 Tax=Chryseolinea sp. T2 TaxID=3129255 RepID=UPI0030776601